MVEVHVALGLEEQPLPSGLPQLLTTIVHAGVQRVHLVAKRRAAQTDPLDKFECPLQSDGVVVPLHDHVPEHQRYVQFLHDTYRQRRGLGFEQALESFGAGGEQPQNNQLEVVLRYQLAVWVGREHLYVGETVFSTIQFDILGVDNCVPKCY